MKRIVPYTIIFIGVLIFWTTSNIRYGGNKNWKSFIDSDGKGYYSYLPAIFIYQDLQFGFFGKMDSIYFEGRHQDYRNSYKGKVVDKYYCGTAVMLVPFFFVGHAMTLIAGEPTDGYSKFYALSVNLGAIFYLLTTLYFLSKLLRLYEVPDKIIAFALFVFTFGTNIYYYEMVEPSMSHIYSLFFVTIFVYYAKLWFTEPKDKYLLLLSASLGMVALIRPVNVLIVAALPFIAGSWPVLLKGLKDIFRNKILVVVCVVIMIAICSIQLILYKIQTGDFFVFSYSTERFIWSDPKMFKLLFGYRKGLFVYTPLLFISLVGLIWVYKQSKFQFYSFLVFFVLLTYVLSSWWCWWYGGGFGMRAFLEFYSLFVILFGMAFKLFNTRYVSIAYITLACLLLIVCQIQTYQARYYYIHPGEMSKEQYWRVFLRIDWALAGTHKQSTNVPDPGR